MKCKATLNGIQCELGVDHVEQGIPAHLAGRNSWNHKPGILEYLTQPNATPTRIVDFSVKMRSRAAFQADAAAKDGLPITHQYAIKLQPITADMIELTNLPADTTWAWCIVETIRAQPDKLILGGTATSITSAESQAREAFKRLETKSLETARKLISHG